MYMRKFKYTLNMKPVINNNTFTCKIINHYYKKYLVETRGVIYLSNFKSILATVNRTFWNYLTF